jgi:hypothetical protein
MVVTTWEPPSIGRGDGTRGAPAVETTDVRARLHGKPAFTVGDGATQRSDRQPGVPMKRIDAMSAVPSAARWLTSHESKDVTGVVLPVAFRRGSGRCGTLRGAVHRRVMCIDSFTRTELQARLGAAGLSEIA